MIAKDLAAKKEKEKSLVPSKANGWAWTAPADERKRLRALTKKGKTKAFGTILKSRKLTAQQKEKGQSV